MAQVDVRAGVPFQLQGFWWEAEGDPEGRSYGLLRYAPDTGITLELVDDRGRHSSDSDDTASRDLHGVTTDGVPCTVFDALNVNSTVKFPSGLQRREWQSSVLAYGAWLRGWASVPVSSVVVEWRGLTEWITRPSRGVGGGQRGLSPDSDHVTFEVDGATVSLGLERTSRRTSLEHVGRWSGTVRVDTPEPVAMTDFSSRYLTPLRDLIIFGTSEETAIDTLMLSGLDEGLPDDASARSQVEWVVWDSARPLTPRRTLYKHMLLPLSAWGDEAGSYLERWVELHRQLGKAASLLFATLNNRPPHIENWFLNLVGFAEVYHRTMRNAPPLPAQEHETAVAAMLKALPDERLRKHYETRLEHAGEQGFRSRLKDLFRRAEGSLTEVETWRKDKLPDRLIDTRNNLTHRAGEGDETLEGGDLFGAGRRLLVVLQVNLMLDLAMAPELVAARVKERYLTDPSLFR